MFNFPFADDAPDKKKAAIALFDEIKAGKYIPYTSAYVVDELLDAEEPKQSYMIQLITDYAINILPYNDAAEKLADKYLQKGVIPKDHRTDALHIATTTVNGLDGIISYNFKHIVKQKTIKMVEIINRDEGYRRIDINIPEEVIDYDS